MRNIKKLPEKLINIIAAGEVVERPASVIKELLENSIDAGADKITVYIKDGGLDEIRIIDNGVGISKEDLPLVIERHATSKISSQKDLESLYTFGFRGEAIASISEVSGFFEIHSQVKGNEASHSLIKTRDSINLEKAPIKEPGTEITIKNLFQHVPARKKFLKSTQTETKHITDSFVSMTIPYHNIHFELIIDKKPIYNLPKVSNTYYRIYEIFGRNNSSKLLQNESDLPNMKIYGYIGSSELAKKSNTLQYIFINNRYIKSPLIHSAIRQGFQGKMPRDYKPSYIIFIDLNPREFDINVHPRKLEVKFSNEQEIFGNIHRYTSKTLEKEFSIQEKNQESRVEEKPFALLVEDKSVETYKNNIPTKVLKNYSVNHLSSKSREKYLAPRSQIKQSIEFTKALSPSNPTNSIFEDKKPFHASKKFKSLLDCYIYFERDNNLVIIDQNQLSKKKIRQEIDQIGVKNNFSKIDLTLELKSNIELEELIRLKPILLELGIKIEQFGDKTIIVREIANFIREEKVWEIMNHLRVKKNRDKDKIESLIININAFQAFEKLNDLQINQLANHADENDWKVISKENLYKTISKLL